MKCKIQAYEFLVDAILSNRLPPGASIIETEIATTLNISRTPVREAIRQLEAEGLVTHYPLQGTIVSAITPYDVDEIFYLRVMLEVSALRLSYDKLSEEELNNVEKMFNSLDPGSEREEYAFADKTLHSLIVDKAGNFRLKQFLNTLNVQIERFRRLASQGPTGLSKSKNEHLDIIHKLRLKDLKACEASLEKHLNSVKSNTMETVRLFHMDIGGK